MKVNHVLIDMNCLYLEKYDCRSWKYPDRFQHCMNCGKIMMKRKKYQGFQRKCLNPKQRKYMYET